MRISIFLWLVLIAMYPRLFGGDVILASGSGQCLGDEQSLLLNLKNSLVFNPSLSTKLVRWNQSVGSWDGVTCDAGRVTGLDLSNESISDGINSSSSLFSLQHLQKLNLAFNSFNFTAIPPEFGNLTGLVYLNLSNAGFAGQIPITLSGLTKLITLDLSVLYFPGTKSVQLMNPNLTMFVGNLRELEVLYLDGVNISAPGGEWCHALSSSLPNLRELSMSNCYLAGPLDQSLMNLKSLSVIRLGNNNLSTTVPGFFANFSNLTSLRLSSSGLYGKFPEEIFRVPTLQALDLSNNLRLQGSLPEFPGNSSVQTLLLSFTGISGELPSSIGGLQNLSRVELVNCSFRGQIPTSMSNLSRLVHLDFSFNNFTGPIPPFSGSKNLTQIIFSHNGLTGQINSTHWENVQNLQILDLRYNSLDGGIPPSLFTLPLVQKIQLSDNEFSGQVQLNESLNFSSYQLDTLDLSSNNLEGPLPTALLEFPELKYISLSFNNFNGSLNLDIIQKVGSLSYLDLSHNNLSLNASTTASATGSFPPLSTVKLASCHLRKLPNFLQNQSKLIYLDLSDNEIDGMIPEWIWNLNSLLYLNLSSNLLEGMGSRPLNLTDSLIVIDLHNNMLQGPLPPLPLYATYVDYSSNAFSSVIPENIGQNLSVIIFFSLSNNRLHGSINESICQADYLQVLDLSANNLTGEIPACLTMNSLKVLNLRNNSLHGIIPNNFSAKCGLKTLDLSRNQLEGQLPKSLQNCTMLEVLDVGNNLIDDIFPCHFKNTTKLRVLVLRSNKFSGTVGCPEINGTWNLLQIVDLAHNNFSGPLPQRCLSTWDAMQGKADSDHLQFSFLQLSQLYYQDTITVTMKGLELELLKILTIFTSIDLSGNRIEGHIPDVLGNFSALKLLNLSHNALTGAIPSALGNLEVLESLDLSDNYLSGMIPSELTNLNFLSFLNLSRNQLAGRIPQGKQFNTFAKNSYLGNSGLCGMPLSRNCSSTNSNGSVADEPDAGKVSRAEFDWTFIITGLGFGAGAAMVVAPLTLWKKGRIWFDALIDRILQVLLPMLGFTYMVSDGDKNEDNGKDDMDSDSEEDDDDPDGFDLDKERYCVFCTKLDPSMKRVIHDPKCTCYDPQDNSSTSSSCSSSSSYSSSSSS